MRTRKRIDQTYIIGIFTCGHPLIIDEATPVESMVLSLPLDNQQDKAPSVRL